MSIGANTETWTKWTNCYEKYNSLNLESIDHSMSTENGRICYTYGKSKVASISHTVHELSAR